MHRQYKTVKMLAAMCDNKHNELIKAEQDCMESGSMQGDLNSMGLGSLSQPLFDSGINTEREPKAGLDGRDSEMGLSEVQGSHAASDLNEDLAMLKEIGGDGQTPMTETVNT